MTEQCFWISHLVQGAKLSLLSSHVGDWQPLALEIPILQRDLEAQRNQRPPYTPATTEQPLIVPQTMKPASLQQASIQQHASSIITSVTFANASPSSLPITMAHKDTSSSNSAGNKVNLNSPPPLDMVYDCGHLNPSTIDHEGADLGMSSTNV